MYRGARRTSAYSFELCTFLVWSHAVLGAREAFSGPRTVATMTQPGGRRRQAAGGSHCPGRDGGQGPGARGGHASPRSIAGEHVPGSVSSRGCELRRDVSLGGLQQRSGPLAWPLGDCSPASVPWSCLLERFCEKSRMPRGVQLASLPVPSVDFPSVVRPAPHTSTGPAALPVAPLFTRFVSEPPRPSRGTGWTCRVP